MGEPPPRARGARRVAAAALVAVFAVLLPVTVTATWAHRTVLDTGGYVAAVTPLAGEPAVTAAVSRRLTDELYAAVDPTRRLAEVLPPGAAALSTPLAAELKGLIRNRLQRALDSAAFRRLWVSANRAAHDQVLAVLRGDTRAVQTTNGQVVLNLVPLLNGALADVGARASALLGRDVQLPAVRGEDVPATTCRRIGEALGRPVPDTCGQLPLFPADRLTAARRGVRAFDGAVLLLLVLTPLVAVAALVAATRRRRTVLQLTVAGMLGLVVAGLLVRWQQVRLAGAPGVDRPAAEAVLSAVLHGLYRTGAIMLLAGVVVLVGTLVTGPYRWARALRSVSRRPA